MQTANQNTTNKYAKVGKKKITYKNGHTKLTLDDLSAPSYEQIMKEIHKKVGDRPGLPKDLPKGNWTEQSLKVLSERYLIKDKDLKPIETPEDMVWRVAWEIASAEARWGAKRKDVEKRAREFYLLMTSREFLPNSPTLMKVKVLQKPKEKPKIRTNTSSFW